MEIKRKSILTGVIRVRDLPITEAQLAKYHEGTTPIQYIMPNLSTDDREFFMTGITPEEWAVIGEGEE